MEELKKMHFKDQMVKDAIFARINEINDISKSVHAGKKLGELYTFRYDWYKEKQGKENTFFKNTVHYLNSIGDNDKFEMWVVTFVNGETCALFVKDDSVEAGLIGFVETK